MSNATIHHRFVMVCKHEKMMTNTTIACRSFAMGCKHEKMTTSNIITHHHFNVFLQA